MARIFISHSSKDNAEAIALARWLEAEGWDDYFLDLHPERGIVAGARWEKALHDAAHRCQAVVFLVSRQWLASEWCLRELQLAHRLDKHIFGVLIDEVDIASVPAKLKDHWQLVDLAGGRDHGAPVAVDLPDGDVRHVTFSQSGLGRLKAGLVRAEIDARFFSWPPPNDPERPPWRGMLPLEAEDAGIFHGREAPIIEVLDRLRGLREAAPPRLLAILGASGAGKSSFLRAGLMARLARDDRTFLALPVVRPGRAVLSGDDGIAKALHTALEKQGIDCGPGAVASAISEGVPAVLALLHELAERARAPALDGEEPPEPPTLVLAMDQGEELFAADGRAEAERFMSLLAGLLRAEVPKLIVLVAIRSDSYERLQIAPELEGLRQRAFSLPPLPRGAYQQVVEGPAERLKGTPRELRIEPALTARLLADVGEGGARDALPLLAFTLSQLYRSRTKAGAMALADYEAMGGIGGAIGAAVERALEAAARDPALPREREAQLALLRRAMIPWLAGIDPETGTPRRKEAKLSEIPEEARPLVRHLVAERLLSTDRAYSGDDRDGAHAAADAATVEPAHEALLRQWSLLKGWLEEDAGRLAALEGVRRATRDWLANARDAAWLSHRAGRLEDAEQLAERPDLAARLDEDDHAYVAACRKAENDARDKELTEARRLAEAQRVAAERQRQVAVRTRIGAIAALLLALLAGGFGWWGWDRAEEAEAQRIEAVRLQEEADAQRRKAEDQAEIASEQEERARRAAEDAEERLRQAQTNESRYLASVSSEELRRGDADLALSLSLLALPDDLMSIPHSRPLVSTAVTALYEALNAGNPIIAVLAGHDDTIWSAAFSSDSQYLVTASNDADAIIWDVSSGVAIAVLKGHREAVRSVVFSPDGSLVLTASDDGTARIWDGETGTEIAVLEGHSHWVWSAAFSPDGKRVVTASMDGTVRIWDASNFAQLNVLSGAAGGFTLVAYSPDSTRMAAASETALWLWDADTGSSVAVLDGQSLSHATFSPDGARLMATSFDGTVRIWDSKSGIAIVEFEGHSAGVTSGSFSPDGSLLATASYDNTARIWNSATGAFIAELLGHSEMIEFVEFSPDGLRLVTASHDGTIRVWDAANGSLLDVRRVDSDWISLALFSPDGTRLLAVSGAIGRLWNADHRSHASLLDGHFDTVNTAVFSREGTRILTASGDGTGRLWDAAEGVSIAELRGHREGLYSAAFSPDGTRVVTASADGTARLWDSTNGTEIAVLDGHSDEVTAATFSADGAQVVTASSDSTARLWSSTTGAKNRVLDSHSEGLASVAFSADGLRVVTASQDHTARLWDAASGVPTAVLKGHSETVHDAAFSPDGAQVATGSSDNTARLWNAQSGDTIAVLEGHSGSVGSVAFSPNGALLVTASVDGTVRLWDAVNGDAVAVLDGHSREVWYATFSPDSSRVLTASNDGTARLWDSVTGAAIAVLQGHSQSVNDATFSSDGTRVVTASDDGTAKIWNVPIGLTTTLPVAFATELRSLSADERRRFNLDPLPGKLQAFPPVQLCDLLAGHPSDPAALIPGIGFEDIDHEAAIAACEVAVEEFPEEPRYQLQLGRAYDKAELHEEALAVYWAAAEAGYAIAFNNLANMFHYGDGVEQDLEEARRLYERALAQGAAVAGGTLGQMHWHSEGVDENRLGAVEVWRKAAALGDPNSHEYLAWVAELGRDGTAADPALALYHYAVAVRLFEQLGLEEDAVGPRYRRGTLARLLEPEIVAARWREAMAFEPVPTQP